MSDRHSPHLQLGRQCRALNRHADAERHFKNALAEDPNDDLALQELVLSIHLQDNREKEALEVIDRAIAIDPNDASHHVCRSFILSSLERPADALKAARMARELDPHFDSAMTAEAQAHLLLKNWKDAERAAREALAIDPDDAMPANLLAQALRMQGRNAENAAQIAGMLERDPENEITHANAGWSALQRGDHRAAEIHFREALRLNPSMESAREGLLTSFRARSPFYRGYLAYCLWMARLQNKAQWAVILGLYFGFRILRSMANKVSPGLAIAIGAIYFLLVLWMFVANAFGNFILLSDSFARHALRRRERIEAWAVGGSIVVGGLFLIGAFATDFGPALIIGGALLLASIPLSMVFTNRSKIGACLFGSVALTLWIGALLLICGFPSGVALLQTGTLCAILSTWLSSTRLVVRR